MATFKICVRKQRKDLLYPIYIRITHNRKAGYIKTNKVADKSSIRQDELKNPTLLAYPCNIKKRMHQNEHPLFYDLIICFI